MISVLIRTVALAALLVVFAAGPGSAATLNIVSGTSGVIPGGADNAPERNNDFLDSSVGQSFGLPMSADGLKGYFSSQITSSATSFLYEFFGSEAGWRNVFKVFDAPDGNVINSFDTGGNTTNGGLGTFWQTPQSFVSTSLFFEFSTSGNTTTANNWDTNSTDSTNVNFFASFGVHPVPGDPDRSGNGLWLFLDDGGAGPNDNHDDMVIRITAVPVPAALPLFGTALAAFGFIGWRRRRHAAA